jgi:hypothetical protein
MTYDPEERFSIYPTTGEEALKKVLGAEDDEDVSEEPEDEEPES